jgi:hypothetical protein
MNKDMEIEKTDTDVHTNMVIAIPLVKVWKVFNLVIKIYDDVDIG